MCPGLSYAPGMEERWLHVSARDLWCWRHAEVLRTAGVSAIGQASLEMATAVAMYCIDEDLDPTAVLREMCPLCCWLPTDVMDHIYARHAILN